MRGPMTVLLAAGLSACQVEPLDVNINVPEHQTPALVPPDLAVAVVTGPAAGITVKPTRGLTTTASGGTATFTIVLDAQPAFPVTIGLVSSDLTQGTVSPGSVSFNIADWERPKTVTVTGADDGIVSGDHVYTVRTLAAVSADPDYLGIDAADVTLTNVETDVAGVRVVPTSGLFTRAGSTTASFTVRLNSIPKADVTVGPFISSNLNQGTVNAPTSLTFTSLTWSTPQKITLTGVDDLIFEGDTLYTISSAAAVSTDLLYTGLPVPLVTVTNQEVDVVAIDAAPTANLKTTKSGGTATFSVKLNSQPTGNVGITVASSNGTKGVITTPASGVLPFTSANWATTQPVVVTGVNDNVATGPTNYSVTLTPTPATADPFYKNLAAVVVPIKSIDTNTAGIDQTAGPLTTTEGGGTASLSLNLTTAPTSPVTINIKSDNTGQCTIVTTALIFNSGNYSNPQFVTVTGQGQNTTVGPNAGCNIVSNGGSVSSDPNYSGLTITPIPVTNADDDINVWVGNVMNDMSFCHSPSATDASACVSLGGVFTVPVNGTVNFLWQEGGHRIDSCAGTACSSGSVVDANPPSWVNQDGLLSGAGNSSLATMPATTGDHPFYCSVHGYAGMNGIMRAQ